MMRERDVEHTRSSGRRGSDGVIARSEQTPYSHVRQVPIFPGRFSKEYPIYRVEQKSVLITG
ncbi:MAG: hypothetical protein ACM3NI_10575, partial [Bacteroidota bacterium]